MPTRPKLLVGAGGKIREVELVRPPSGNTFRLGGGPNLYLRDLDGDGIEELGIVEGTRLRATRSRGGTFELDGRYRSTPTQIDVYTAQAN